MSVLLNVTYNVVPAYASILEKAEECCWAYGCVPLHVMMKQKKVDLSSTLCSSSEVEQRRLIENINCHWVWKLGGGVNGFFYQEYVGIGGQVDVQFQIDNRCSQGWIQIACVWHGQTRGSGEIVDLDSRPW